VATLFRLSRHAGVARWYSRFIIPADLRPFLCRREILKSLGNVSYSEASLRAAVWEGRIASLLLRVRRHSENMNREEIQRLAQQWLAETLEAVEDSCRLGSPSDDEREALSLALSDALEATEGQLLDNDFSKIEDEVDELLHSHGHSLSKETEAYRRLCRELLKAKQTALKTEMDWREGKYWGRDSLVFTAPPAVRPVHDRGSDSRASVLLSVAGKAYLKDLERRAPGTLAAKANVLNRFMEIVGDKDLHAITDQDCLRYRDTLAKLPAHMTKRYPGKTAAQVLAETEGKEGIERLSLQTINQDLTHLRHFFGWAIAKPRRYIVENPIEGLFYEGVESKQYEAFTDEDIARLFTSEEYTDQLRQRRYGRHWLPLILLYSGARREELANLAISDVKTEKGIPYFDIAPDSARGRRLKNKASKRRVPIHSHLVELGLLHYVKQRRTAGELLLFSKQKNEGKGRETVGDSVGKWLARLLAKENIEGKKSLHSFRATVTTKLYEAGVDGETRRELLGHSGKDVHEQVYLRPPLQALRVHLEKLDFRPLLKGLPKFKA
jgi:integrase